MERLDDGTLFGLWLDERDEQAFAALARRHASTVFDLAARALQDRTAADDVVQEALLDLALEKSRRPVEVGVAAWLVRYAICKARNRRASERSRARRQQVVGARRAEVVMPDESLERSDELDVALARAEPEERVILAMRYLHGWDYARIARALEISEGAARVRVHRALRSVRTKVGADGEERLIGCLGALPVLTLPESRIDVLVGSVLDTAKGQIAAETAATTSTGTLGRYTLHTVRVVAPALLLTALGIALDTPESPAARGDAPAALVAGISADAVHAAPAEHRSADRWRPGVGTTHPRPRAWDDGELARLGRGEDEPGIDVPARARRRTDSAPVERAPDPKRNRTPKGHPEDTQRKTAEHARATCPILREATAARCDPAPSVDGRAGAFAGSADRPDETGQDAALSDLASPTGHATRRSGGVATGTPLDRLDPEKRELVDEAVALVLDLVDGDLESLAKSRHRVEREMKRVARKYRVRRRRAIRAAAEGDAVGAAAQSVVVMRLSRTQKVLSHLVHVALADGRTAGEIIWPEGADVDAALEELVRVLGSTSPESGGPLPEGLDAPDSTHDPAADDSLGAALPDGLFES